MKVRKPILGFIVLFAFVFSSCATIPANVPAAVSVGNPNHKSSRQFQVYPFYYPNIGYANPRTFGVSFRYIDLLAAETIDETKPNTGTAKTSSFSDMVLTIIVVGGTLGVAGGLVYKYVTNPDSFTKK